MGLRGISDGEFRRWASGACMVVGCLLTSAVFAACFSRPALGSCPFPIRALLPTIDREYFHLDFLKHVSGVTVTENKLVGEKKSVGAESCRGSQLTLLGRSQRGDPASAHRHGQARVGQAHPG